MEPCLFRHGKEALQHSLKLPSVLLQWSHVFSDMVSSRAARDAGNGETLQWSHVFSDMVSECALDDRPQADRRFNGAMSFQTW